MKKRLEGRAFLACLGIVLILGTAASVVVSLDSPSKALLHDVFFVLLAAGSGILYVLLATRRFDPGISFLSLGGALVALVPSFLVSLPLVPLFTRAAEASELLTPDVFLSAAINMVMGAFLGCVLAVVTAMWREAWLIRRRRSREDARPMPGTRRRD